MSTEQTVDPELVEQTKQQIRHLVREIAQISKSDIAPQQYYDALLNRVVSALAAAGGAIWTLDQGRLDLQYQIGLRQTGLADSPEDQQRHGRLLQRVLQTGEGVLVSPHSGTGDDDEGANPTPFLLLLGPLKSDQEVQGIVEVFQRPDTAISVQQGYLRFLLQMCDLAGDYLKTRSLRHFTDRQTLWAQLEQFTRLVHRSLDPRSTAYTIANEGRRLIECDRVSVGICRQHKCRIEAVSGQDTFDKRSNVVSLLSRLATAVTATGETIWYTGDTSRLAPQVEEAVQAYVDESHSKVVGVIPLRRPVEEATADKQQEDDPGEVIGALIVEQIEDSRPHEGLLSRVEVISLHGSTALSNALEYHHIFLLPLWLALGKISWVLKARTLPKTMAIASAVGVLFLWLLIWPATFNLEGKGTLEPTMKRDVFAAVDGTVEEVRVEHGDFVKRGQILATLSNPDLESKVIEMQGNLAASKEKMHSLHAALNKPKHGSEDPYRVEAELAEEQKKEISYREQLKVLMKKREQLVVASPIDGQINTWHVSELLLRRPVRQGQVLMSVADPAGDWELEVHMPEDRIGHVALARLESRPELPVRFRLSVSPGDEHEGIVREVHAHAEVRGEEGNTVLVRVTLDKAQLRPTDMRPGATVNAKINCGRVPIGYKYFHDVIAFIQLKILFRL
jgi:multidrug efflux pump subunit AcrA (membrane-fusion protein)